MRLSKFENEPILVNHMYESTMRHVIVCDALRECDDNQCNAIK